jgi:hypothetical protein
MSRLYYPDGTTRYDRRLPHLRRRGSTYFATWRIHRDQADLDGDERTVVLDAMHFFHDERYDLLSAVVMNDHAHAILWPYPGEPLEWIMHSWKSFTVRTMHRNRWRTGSVWLDESFDRIIRGDSDLEEKKDYVLRNPWKRWPLIDSYDWVYPEPYWFL